MTELGALFTKYGCDKSSKHHYDNIYHPNLMHLRNEPINLLEVGVFKGASTKAWLEYFPKATIYGIDIFERVPMESLDVWSHPRVRLLKADSRDPNTLFQIIDQWPEIEFDVIIDDGLHTPLANHETFGNLWPLLAKHGQYFVEDVWPLHLMSSAEMKHQWIAKHPGDYTREAMQLFLDRVHQNTVIEHDLRRKSGEPDSYIFKIT